MRFWAIIALSLFLAGCGGAEDGADPGPAASYPDRSQIRGIPAEEYYQRFFYKIDGSQHFQLVGKPEPLIRVDEGEIQFTTLVYVFDSGDYLAVYQERLAKDGAGAPETTYKKTLWGRWKVQNGSLVLERFGTLDPDLSQEAPVLLLTLDSKINTEGAHATVSRLTYQGIPAGMEETRKDLIDSGGAAWLSGEWVRKDYRDQVERFSFGAQPRTLFREVFRPVIIEDRPGPDCHMKYRSNQMQLDGEPLDGRMNYVLIYQVSDVELVMDLKNASDCQKMYEREKRRIQNEQLWYRLEVRRNKDGTLLGRDGETYTRK